MARSPYSSIRSNIMKKQKRLLAKGYDVSGDININIPKISELGHEPTQEDIKMLRDYEKQILNIYSKKISDSETGTEKKLTYEEARKYERQQAYKKGQITKILNETADIPKYEYETNDDWIKGIDDDYIIYTKEDIRSIDRVKRRIGELVNFKSSAKNQSVARHNETIVQDIGNTLLSIFEQAEETDYDGLLNRLRDNAMNINSDLDRAKTAYLEEDNGVALTERLIEVFIGRHLTVDEAKHFDTGYDEPIQTDENGEVIE